MGQYYGTYLRIENKTRLKITNTTASNMDNYDWNKDAHPRKILSGLEIEPGHHCTKYFEAYTKATGWPYTMTLDFENGSYVKTRIRQVEVYNHNGYEEKENLRDDWLMWSPFEVKISIENADTIVLTIVESDNQYFNRIAMERNKNGEMAFNNNKLKTAMKYFSDAVRFATLPHIRSDIQRNLSRTYVKLATQEVNQSLNVETKGEAEKAEKLLNDAKSKLEEGTKLVNSSDNRSKLDFVTLKIEGNNLFNSALKTELEASMLLQNALESDSIESAVVVEKYEEALTLYQDSLKKFEKADKLGMAELEWSKKMAQEQIAELEQLVPITGSIILQERLEKIDMRDKEETEEREISTEDESREKEIISVD